MVDPRALLHQTRRHFFGQCGVGLGSMALGSLLGEGRASASGTTSAAEPLAPRPGTSPPGRRASSTCSWPAGRASSSSSTTSPSSRSTTASRSPSRSSRASGSRSWRPSPRSRRSSWGRRGSSRSTASRGPGSRSACPTSRRSSTTSPSSARWRPTSSTTRPAKLFVNTGTTQFGRPSMGAWVTYGIGSESQRPARLRRAPVGPARPARRGGQLGERLPADGLPGRPVPVRRRADPQPDEPRGGHARPAAAGDRRDPRPEPRPAGRDRRPRDRHPDRLLRDGLPDADRAPRS